MYHNRLVTSHVLGLTFSGVKRLLPMPVCRLIAFVYTWHTFVFLFRAPPCVPAVHVLNVGSSFPLTSAAREGSDYPQECPEP